MPSQAAPPGRPARPPLLPHQQDAHDFILTHPACAVWLPVGAAKTRLTLQALETLHEPGHILVVAPLQIARNSWTGEVAKWGFGVRVRSLVDRPHKHSALAAQGRRTRHTRPERQALYAELRDPATHPALWVTSLSVLEELILAMGFDQPCGPEDFLPAPAGARWPFTTVVIDEAQEFKNPQANRFRMLFQTRPYTRRMIQLTGTPAPQDLQDLWAQMALLDGGAALGGRFTEFRGRYFTPDKYVNNRPVSFEPRPGANEEIHQRVAHLAISRENHSNVRPPEPRITTRVVRLDPATMERYEDFVRERVLELAPDLLSGAVSVIAADTAAHLRAVLLQFASGTVYNGPGHLQDFEVVHDAKLEALVEVIHTTATPVMVAYRFQADQTRLLTELPALGIPVEKFDGSPAMVKRWNAGNVPVMLLQPASSGRGLNLQHGGATLVWYTLPDSSEHWIQTNGRLVRIGQTQVVDIIRLVTADTTDTLQVPRLAGKLTTQADLLEAVRDIIAGSTRQHATTSSPQR